MTLLRALSIPFHFTSVVFISLLSLLLATAVHYDTSGFLWLAPAAILTSWLFKYAFAMLESIADGETQAPVVSIEMLGVFEQRPLVLLLMLLAIGQFMLWMDSIMGYVLVAILLALLPASIGILGATCRTMLSLNPFAILQTARGMGWRYLLVLLAIFLAIVLSAWMASVVWRPVWYFLIGMSVLMVFSIIGGMMYERRIEIGHEPRVSPERIAARDQREHRRQLKQALDEIYSAIRLGDLLRGMEQLQQWLSSVDDEWIASDCHAIHATICTWNDNEMLVTASRALVITLAKTQHVHMLAEIVAATLTTLPVFTLKSENALLQVVHDLQSIHRNDLALVLTKNFVNTFPVQVTPGVTALLQRLCPVKQ